MPDGKLMEKTHGIVRIGDNPISHIPALIVVDESYRKLVSVEGRVLHTDGSSEKFTSGDFLSYNMSDRHIISDESVKSAFLEKKLKSGDLVETVSIHELTYPQLGIGFSLSELDYPAENITCCIESSLSDSIRYRVVNDDITPSIIDSVSRKFVFHWNSYRESKKRRGVLQKHNLSPTVLAVRSSQTWQSFGDWYLQLIASKLQPARSFADSARRITAGKLTPKDMMDAIFDYCQRNVRYEQVFLKQGEFIPDDVNEILEHKYGDCKDYSCLMYAMAVSVGLKPQLVLCYRGRGEEFFGDMPMSQFNHAILHFKDDGRDYWYDGTNRAGLAGITSFDLANARVLILEEKNSVLSVIEDSPENNLAVNGNLLKTGENDLQGTLNVVFSNQFAVDLFWLEHQTNKEEFTGRLNMLLKKALNENIEVDSLSWISSLGSFAVQALCKLPNCIMKLQNKSFISIATIFPGLLPRDMENEKIKEVFFFPYYNRVSVSVTASGGKNPVTAELHFQLPAGPFTNSSRTEFLKQLDSVNTAYNKNYTLTEISN